MDFHGIKKGGSNMLKTKSIRKIVLLFTTILFILGVSLTVLGFSMNDDLSYLKEDGKHKWYQVIYVDQEDNLHIGLKFHDDFQIMSIF